MARHAKAKRVEIALGTTQDAITLIISDDGIGFDGASQINSNGKAGWGIMGIRERAAAVGGTLRIESSPGNGARITITVTR